VVCRHVAMSPLNKISKILATNRTAGLLVAPVLAIGLVLAGCASNDQRPAEPGGSTADPNSKAVKYAQCMREHGITDFPDPVDGEIRLTVRAGTNLDPNSPEYQAAQQACKSLEPPGLSAGSGQSADAQAAGVKFAVCMRENGVPDFPDPQNGRFLVSGDIDPNSPAFRSAMNACRDLAPAGMPGAGQ
jgi:hypothetical protein